MSRQEPQVLGAKSALRICQPKNPVGESSLVNGPETSAETSAGFSGVLPYVVERKLGAMV